MSRPPNTTEASNDHHSDFGDFDEALASPCLRDPPVDEREHHSRRSDLGMNDSRAVSPDNNVRYQGRSGLRSHSTGHRRKASLSPATVRQRELSASPAPQGQETIPITGPAAHHHQQQQQRRRQPQAKVRRPFSRARWLARAKKRIRNGLDGFWSRNKGLALVFMSQFFGTLMNVTTRILEKEGNEGKGMHPFQVSYGASKCCFCGGIGEGQRRLQCVDLVRTHVNYCHASLAVHVVDADRAFPTWNERSPATTCC